MPIAEPEIRAAYYDHKDAIYRFAWRIMDRDRQAPPALADEVSLSDFQPVSELKPRIIRRIYESN
jgi:hypothetical protein